MYNYEFLGNGRMGNPIPIQFLCSYVPISLGHWAHLSIEARIQILYKHL